MNIIINGFMHPEQKQIYKYFETYEDIEKNCIICDYKYEAIKNNTDLFIVQDIIKGNYPYYGVLTPEQIDFINSNFFQLMEMLNRFYAYLHKEFSYEEKKNIIYKHFAFWMEYIKVNNISCFISSNIPHDIYDHIILLCMKYYKKDKILFFLQSQFKDMIIPMHLVEEQNIKTKIEYEKISRLKVDLTKYAEIEWKIEKNEEIPFYMKRSSLFTRIIKDLRKIKKITIKKLLVSLSYNSKTKKLKKEYRLLSKPFEPIPNYIYFPLHFQPEMTSCMLGPTFVNQYLLIHLVDKLLPDGWKLLVKEHPKQQFCNRYFGYYKDILMQTKNTCLVNFDTNSYDLIKHCRAVLTISGTAGWEALFHEKPVLLCGNNFYQYAPGVFHIVSESDLKNALSIINGDKFIYDENKLKAYLNSVEKTSIHGFVDSVYSSTSSFSFIESNENIIQYINNWLQCNEN